MLVVACAGCVGKVATADGRELHISGAAFRQYAEAVFRRQNRLIFEIVLALEDAEGDDATESALFASEATLLAACAALNAAAHKAQTDGVFALLRGKETAKSVPACEMAAAETAELLERRAARAP